jgi:hypothetical protein
MDNRNDNKNDKKEKKNDVGAASGWGEEDTFEDWGDSG